MLLQTSDSEGVSPCKMLMELFWYLPDLWLNHPPKHAQVKCVSRNVHAWTICTIYSDISSTFFIQVTSTPQISTPRVCASASASAHPLLLVHHDSDIKDDHGDRRRESSARPQSPSGVSTYSCTE
jgi:hypothetical protein